MVTEAAAHGLLSLMVSALIIVGMPKYLVFVLEVDSEGECSIIPLLVLALPAAHERGGCKVLLIIGVTGAALLYGDGLMTSTVSVRSTVEGLSFATPLFEHYVVPINLAILLASSRSSGTAAGGLVASWGW